MLKELRQFRRELARLRQEASERLGQAPAGPSGIIERGIHAKGEAGLGLAGVQANQQAGRAAKRLKEIAPEGLTFQPTGRSTL